MQPDSPSPHSHTLRKGRHAEPGYTYLLTAVIKDRRPLFSELKTGRLLIAELRDAEQQGLVQSLAWVVMPDHMHGLITLRSASLSTLMRRIKGRSAIAINKVLGSQVPIWQPGFHDRALREEDDLPAIARRSGKKNRRLPALGCGMAGVAREIPLHPWERPFEKLLCYHPVAACHFGAIHRAVGAVE